MPKHFSPTRDFHSGFNGVDALHILLIEDNAALAQGLKIALSKEGFIVNHVASGQHGLETVKTSPPDIVVLDLGLPDLDGLQVLQRLRKLRAHLPMLILTARNQLDDKVKGLESGADDYLPKPFEMAELVARLRVIERRLTGVTDAHITIHQVTLFPQYHLAKTGDENLELSRREFMLLKTLMENAGKVQTRNTLEARLYSWDEEVASNSLEVHIHNLRKKLGADFIKTVRGVGYMVPK